MFQKTSPNYAALASLLDYPTEQTRADADELQHQTGLSKTARKHIAAFQSATRNLTVVELQELHTRTFDLSPLCSPALSVHLFGVESFKRSHLMVGLLDQYNQSGFQTPSETADNMVTVLRYLAVAPASVRVEMIEFIVNPALKKMATLLLSKSNPYGEALSAAESVLTSEAGKELTNA